MLYQIDLAEIVRVAGNPIEEHWTKNGTSSWKSRCRVVQSRPGSAVVHP
jgi:hypothetical protein